MCVSDNNKLAAAPELITVSNQPSCRTVPFACVQVLQCMKLEHCARLLETATHSRPYNRLHPRYTLE